MPTPRPRRVVRLLSALAGLILSACSIEEPRLPEFETEWLVPLGARSYTIAELLEDQDGLVFGPDGLVTLRHEGTVDPVAVGDVLDIDVDGRTVDAEVGTFELSATDPTAIQFTLGELYAPANGLDGLDVVVPPFVFGSTSPPQDFPQISAATIESGGIEILISNGLPVPVGGPNPPESITVEVVDPGTGNVVTAATYTNEIAAGQSSTQFVDLAGVVLPGSIEIRLAGGSPGSSGSPVTIDKDALLEVTVTPVDLVASDAVAEVGPQQFQEITTLDLPASPQLVSGEIASGTLDFSMSNSLAIPVDVDLTVDAFLDDAGQPLRIQLNLPPGASANPSVDLTQYRVDFGGQPGTSIEVNAQVTSPGSGGQEVTLQSTARVDATIQPFTVGFSEVTGILDPETIDLAPTSSSLTLPDELGNIELAAAELRFTVQTSVGMPGQVAMRLEGTNDDGVMVPLDLMFDVPAAPAGQALDHEVVFDANNSDILPFLNNLPTSITMAGSAQVGDGVTRGSVATDDVVSASYSIDAPLLVSISAQDIELDVEALDLGADLREQLDDRLIDATLETTVTSTLPIAVEAYIALDDDSATVFSNPDLLLGPVDVPASVRPRGDPDFAAGEATSQLALRETEVPVLTRDTLFQGVRLSIPGTEGAVVSLRSDDQVTVTGYVRARIQVGEIKP